MCKEEIEIIKYLLLFVRWHIKFGIIARDW